MAFVKKTWTDRVAEFINRRLLTKEDGSTELVTVARSEGTVSTEGDGFTAKNMNDLEQRIADEFYELNNALNGFEFTTQNDEDGYLKDGEFHPFGNPYLRFDEDTGYIQVLDINGKWQNIYQASSLPLEWMSIDNIVLANQPYVTFDVGATSYASYVNDADAYVTYSVQTDGALDYLVLTAKQSVAIYSSEGTYTNLVKGGTFSSRHYNKGGHVDAYIIGTEYKTENGIVYVTPL